MGPGAYAQRVTRDHEAGHIEHMGIALSSTQGLPPLLDTALTNLSSQLFPPPQLSEHPHGLCWWLV